MSRHFAVIVLACLILAAGGCSSMRPGKLSSVQPISDKPRAGNVYLLRGWIGIFSTGIDHLTEKLNENGVRAHQYQDDQWRSLARQIVESYKGVQDPEPLVLVGHSYGADDVVNIARVLEKEGIAVDLLITLDPVTPNRVPSNVRLAHNLYQSNGVFDVMPFLRGVPLRPAENFAGTLNNLDIRKERTDLLEPGTDHFNIEKKGRIHDEVIAQVLEHCPPRSEWAARKRAKTPVAVKAPDAPKPATRPVAASEALAAPRGNGH
jgi:hypothetical protein